jgi:hypothetical protein
MTVLSEESLIREVWKREVHPKFDQANMVLGCLELQTTGRTFLKNTSRTANQKKIFKLNINISK